jgi:hypothetical protein
MMDQWIARGTALWGSLDRYLAPLPHSRPALFAALLVLFLWASVLAIAMLRSSRRQKRIEAAIRDINAEIERLHQAEERRTLVELRSNQHFLNEVTLTPVTYPSGAVEQGKSQDKNINAAQSKPARDRIAEPREVYSTQGSAQAVSK